MMRFKGAIRALIHKLFPEKVAKLYDKAEEGLWYIFFGVMTTLVNFLVYIILTRWVFAPLFTENEAAASLLCSWIAWSVAVLAAFFFNRCFVFESHDTGNAFVFQFLSFVGSRVITGVAENSLPALLIALISMNDIWAKIMVSVLIIVLNYLFSKFISFRKKNDSFKYSSK